MARGHLVLALGVGAALAYALRKGSQSPAYDRPLPHGPIGRDGIVQLAQEYLSLWLNADEDTRKALVAAIWKEAVGTEYKGEPWSAAFVTNVVNTAIPGALYRTAKHATYVAKANEGFGSYRVPFLDEDERLDLRPGDIIVKSRPGQPPPTEEEFKRGDYLSHADIVVEVTPDEAITIGGNKANGGVAIERYPLREDGVPLPPAFAVLQLKDEPMSNLVVDLDLSNYDWPEGARVTLSPPGYRRAKSNEVSQDMRENAVQALSFPLGSVIPLDGYAIGIEHHEDAKRGVHKGASVFLASSVS